MCAEVKVNTCTVLFGDALLIQCVFLRIKSVLTSLLSVCSLSSLYELPINLATECVCTHMYVGLCVHVQKVVLVAIITLVR